MIVTGHNAPDDDAQAAPPQGTAASIRDIGRLAGVSHQTVSRVLNGHPNVRPETRGRVQAVIDEVQFRPSRIARDLAVGDTRQVTVLTSNTSLYGYAATLAGIEEAARAAGVRVSIRVLESESAEHVRAAIEDVRDPRSGAVVVVAYDLPGLRALEAMPRDVHMTVAAESAVGLRATDEQRRSLAWFDEVSIAREATRHLLDLGHRTVHFMSIPSSTGTSARERGWREELQAAGAPIPMPTDSGRWEVRHAHRQGLALLADRDVTAVLCGNDDLAIGLVRAARDLGRRVPEDVSVVGFDDIPIAEFLSPALTTVRLDFTALGRQAFHLLELDHPTASVPLVLPAPQLVVRESTAPPP